MDGGDGVVVTPEVRRAYAYLGAVTERPTAELWDLVDEVGPIEACDRIRVARVPEALAEQSASRRDRVD
ncbi:MAG: DNA-protecting protein DprA, partial [Dietzia cercidiphylli]